MVTGRVGLAHIEDRHLAIEADRRARNQRLAVLHAGAVDGVAGGEIVGAVEHHIGGGNFLIQALAGQSFLQRR